MAIDVVIAWVDGNDPSLAEKRDKYLPASSGSSAIPGAQSTRFSSVNEIKYCVLSILRFAPFVRNIFIVTDGQDPGLLPDIKRFFPGREESVRIVDHSEIFEGFSDCLPTFNSISIGNMIWRIRGLSENFVYFNDDTFLVRPVQPHDWFINSTPVLRGRWVLAPLPRILWDRILYVVNRYLRGRAGYSPRASFHMGQWASASLLGFRYRYFTNSHTPHTVGLNLIEDFFRERRSLLEKNISYRFRDSSQFTFIALSNHLQLISGNRHIAKPGLAYLQPYGRRQGYIDKKLKICETNPDIKFLCVQSLDMCDREDQEKILGWMEELLRLKEAAGTVL